MNHLASVYTKRIQRLLPSGTEVRFVSQSGQELRFLVDLPGKEVPDLLIGQVRSCLLSKAGDLSSVDVARKEGSNSIEVTLLTNISPQDLSVQSAIKDASAYTYFKLRSKLTIDRRGKDVVFEKGDPLGWRMSSSGTHIRLISPLQGQTIVYSIKITDQVLKWLDKQDPNAKRKVGQLKSDKPEDSMNRIEGYAVTDGKKYYKMTPKPMFGFKRFVKLLYPSVAAARKDFGAFLETKKLKIIPVHTKELKK